MRFVMKSKAPFTLGNPDKYRSRELSGFGKGLNRYTVSYQHLFLWSLPHLQARQRTISRRSFAMGDSSGGCSALAGRTATSSQKKDSSVPSV